VRIDITVQINIRIIADVISLDRCTIEEKIIGVVPVSDILGLIHVLAAQADDGRLVRLSGPLIINSQVQVRNAGRDRFSGKIKGVGFSLLGGKSIDLDRRGFGGGKRFAGH